MPFLPFILDRSSTAKLIKSIDAPDRSQDKLKALNKIMMNDLQKVPYSYLDQMCRRAELVLPLVKDDVEREVLNSFYMTAFRRIQRIHMESRP